MFACVNVRESDALCTAWWMRTCTLSAFERRSFGAYSQHRWTLMVEYFNQSNTVIVNWKIMHPKPTENLFRQHISHCFCTFRHSSCRISEETMTSAERPILKVYSLQPDELIKRFHVFCCRGERFTTAKFGRAYTCTVSLHKLTQPSYALHVKKRATFEKIRWTYSKFWDAPPASRFAQVESCLSTSWQNWTLWHCSSKRARVWLIQ